MIAKVPFKYDVNYHESNRIQRAWTKCKKDFDLFGHGTLISPIGKEYRYYHKGDIGYNYSWGYRFSHDGKLRDICVSTICRALMLGWTWLSDEERKARRKYTISRWPDGNHFYVRDQDDNPVTYLGLSKFNTWRMAEEAGENWIK